MGDQLWVLDNLKDLKIPTWLKTCWVNRKQLKELKLSELEKREVKKINQMVRFTKLKYKNSQNKSLKKICQKKKKLKEEVMIQKFPWTHSKKIQTQKLDWLLWEIPLYKLKNLRQKRKFILGDLKFKLINQNFLELKLLVQIKLIRQKSQVIWEVNFSQKEKRKKELQKLKNFLTRWVSKWPWLIQILETNKEGTQIIYIPELENNQCYHWDNHYMLKDYWIDRCKLLIVVVDVDEEKDGRKCILENGGKENCWESLTNSIILKSKSDRRRKKFWISKPGSKGNLWRRKKIIKSNFQTRKN